MLHTEYEKSAEPEARGDFTNKCPKLLLQVFNALPYRALLTGNKRTTLIFQAPITLTLPPKQLPCPSLPLKFADTVLCSTHIQGPVLVLARFVP